ncbi:MAG: amino acid adenylation domain-containing protein [Byssovorax sp.]
MSDERARGTATIPDRFAAIARARPGAPAIHGAHHAFTYGALLAEARSIVGGLAAHPDAARVALLGAHDASIAAAALGVLFAGRTYVPLDPLDPPARLAQILGDLEIGAILADAPHRALAASIAGSIPLAAWLGEAPLPAIAPSHPAYILSTSGSTGHPKGVVQSHENLVHHAETYARSLGVVPDDRLSLLASLASDAGLMDLFGALLAGASVHLRDLRGVGFAGLSAWMRERGITVIHATPTVFRQLVAEPGFAVLPAVRRVVLGGEPMRAADLAAFRAGFAPGAILVNGLGLTESTLALQAFFSAVDPILDDPMPVGRAVAGIEAQIVDEHGDASTADEGELALSGLHLALGYAGRPDLTAAAFRVDPGSGARIYRTGDRVRRLADGRFAFLGRTDFQVKIRGHRVELGEIEARLGADPDVAAAVVIARDDASGDTVLLAHVVPRDAATIDPAPILARLRAVLPAPMIPARLAIVDRLPLTPSGKIDRRALGSTATAATSASPGDDPRGPIEARIAAHFRAVLGVEAVSRDDDFFALGGHSLLAARLVARLRAEDGIDVPLVAVFEAPSVAALARWIEAELAAPTRAPRPPIGRAPRDAPIPLSFAEERLWFAEQIWPGDPTYHVPVLLRLRGALDCPALSRALGALVARHEALRTTFPTVDGAPRRRICDAIGLEIERLALPPWRGDPVDRVTSLALRFTHRRFDLDQGPLLRVAVVAVDDRDHLLLLVLHHLAADGATVALLVRELAALYHASRAGLPSPLAALPLQTADHAAWQRATLTGDRLAALLGYWTARLAGLEPLDLPRDLPPPETRSRGSAGVAIILPEPLAAALTALGRETSSTLAMVLLAGFAVLLSRLGGQPDLAIGVPVSGRDVAEIEPLAGTFVNTVVVRITMDHAADLRALLAAVRASMLGAYAHDELPFERLVSALQAPRDPDRMPIVQAMLLVDTTPPPVIAAAGVEVVDVDLGFGGALCDLSLSLRRGPTGLVGSLRCNPDRLRGPTIARYGEHLLALLAAMPAALDRPLWELPDFGAPERRRILVDFNPTARRRIGERSVARRVLAHATRTPSAIAVIVGEERLTYADLDHASAGVAAALEAASVPRGSLIPILTGRSADTVIAMLGILRAGAAFVPLDPRWPPARLASILDQISSPVVVTSAPFAALPPLEGRVAVLTQRAFRGGRASAPAPWPLDSESPIYAMLTSGSTGTPKLAVIPHRGLDNRFAWMDSTFGAAPPITLQTTASVFDSAIWQLLWPLTRGGAVVIPPDEPALPPSILVDLVARHGVTILDFVPSLFDLAIDDLLDAAPRLASLRDVIFGGEAIRREPVARFQQAFRGVRVTNLYGPTEASIGCVAHLVDAASEGEIPIGRPIDNVCAILVDEHGCLTPIGAVGEIHLGGAAVGLGYHGDDAATRAAFVPNPFTELAATTLYRTGDLARQTDDGTLLFVGRRDDQLEVRGLRIEPGEIERALLEHPDVRDAGVLALRRPPAPDRLVAWISPSLPEDLVDFLRARLPEALIPSRFAAATRLPRSAAGKLDRRALAALALPPDAPIGAAPESDLERQIAAIWGDVLGIEAPPVDRGFFDLGGHSLLAVRAHQLLQRALGRAFPLIDLFTYPTIRALARNLQGRDTSTVRAPPDPSARAAALLRQRRRRIPDE